MLHYFRDHSMFVARGVRSSLGFLLQIRHKTSLACSGEGGDVRNIIILSFSKIVIVRYCCLSAFTESQNQTIM